MNPNTISPQGSASVAPIAQPTPQALPQAPTIGAPPAPVATPNFNTAGTMHDIANYYQIPRQTADITNAGQAQAGVAKTQNDAADYQRSIQIERQKSTLDPSKYNFQKNTDGTVTILNPLGQKVDIGTYSALTGDNPAAALQKAGATDQKSQQFIQDYNNLQTYIQAKVASLNGDLQGQRQAADFENNPGNKALANMDLGTLQNIFMKQYGSYFGQSGNDLKAQSRAGLTPTLTSLNNPKTLSPYYGNFPSPLTSASAASSIPTAPTTNPLGTGVY